MIRILLVDDHRLFREGLTSLLADAPDLEVVGTAEDGHEGVAQAASLRPDVALVDVELPGINGIEVTRRISAEVEGTRVIALSMHSRPATVLEMLRAGASGYLLKDAELDDVALAIREVGRGRSYLSPGVAGVVMREAVGLGGQTRGAAYAGLSSREREVVQLLAEGCTVREIGTKLSISPRTVESHRKNVLDKMGLRNLADLTRFAIREGLVSTDR